MKGALRIRQSVYYDAIVEQGQVFYLQQTIIGLGEQVEMMLER